MPEGGVGGYTTSVEDRSNLLDRITVDPEIYCGKPILRGRRLAVEHVLAYLSAGESIESILQGFPGLEREDILACIEYARCLVESEEVVPVGVS